MTKNVIIGVLAALLLVNWYCSKNKIDKYRDEHDELLGKYALKDSAYLAEAQAAKRFKTKDSINVLRVNSLAVSEKTLAAYNEDLKKELKAVKVKAAQIERQTEVATTATGTIKPKTDTVWKYRPDTSQPRQDSAVFFTHSEKFITVEGQVKPDLVINYQYRDSLRLFWHYGRDGFLKRKKIRLTVYSLNPKATITGVKDFEIRTKEKRFFVGIGGSYGYNGSKFVPTLGIIGGFKILRL